MNILRKGDMILIKGSLWFNNGVHKLLTKPDSTGHNALAYSTLKKGTMYCSPSHYTKILNKNVVGGKLL